MNVLEEIDGYCPYCGEPISLLIDRSAGSQSYIEDCSVCCRPMQVLLKIENGGFQVSLRQENEAG